MKAYPNDAIPWPTPPVWRVVLAFIIAPMVIAAVLAGWAQAGSGWDWWLERTVNTTLLFLMFGAYPPTLIVGAPAYMFLRRRVRPTLFNCILAGLLVAGIPALILALLPASGTYIEDGQTVVGNGVKTAWGWREDAEHVGLMCVLGVVTGLIFWTIAVAGTPKRLRPPA